MKKIVLFLLLCFFSASIEATVLDVLCEVQRRCKETKTDSLMIVRCGKTVFHYKSPSCADKIDCGSFTRTFIGIAYALLMDEGRIHNLDMPVHLFFPDWKDQPCGLHTLRHHFCETDNQSLSILGCAVESICGRALSDYLQEKFFKPLQISDVCWDVNGHLWITPYDLAKVGQLFVENGVWQGKTVLGRYAMQKLTTPSGYQTPFTGMLGTLEFYDIAFNWDEALINKYNSLKICPSIIRNLEKMHGWVIHFGGQVEGCKAVRIWGNEFHCAFSNIHDFEVFLKETNKCHVPMARFRTGGLKAWIARDAYGQQLVVMPDKKIVAIRQKRHDDAISSHSVTFDDLCDLLDLYARECDCWID